MDNRPIGIFDSGIGGTSIWKEIHALLPSEHTIYLADSKNAPYGERSPEEILALSIKNTEYLLDLDCKLIVVACNTATTNAIDYLRATYELPFIGIEPAIKPAALQSNSKTVGVLATKGTLSSALFHNTSKIHANGITILEQEGKGLVPLIEAGKENSAETRELLQEYLAPMIAARIDYLVLGCTHYPYLLPVLKELLPGDVQIIDCGEAVARQTRNILQKNEMLAAEGQVGKSEFYINTGVEVLRSILKEVRGEMIIDHRDF
ncbi:MAG: glutamate racemase [Flavobacteriaceae bacterium]|nr:glutamate racemase [Flavobacteriaceae bacterium]